MIEIIVALGVFAVVLVALLPQLIVGIKATGTARVVSQAKGVGQGQLERLRHLPFHIAPAAGDYVDVLDRYFPNLETGTAATCTSAGEYVTPTTAWSGYVAAGAARCDYEPTNGAFYRTVTTTAEAAGIRAFTVVTAVQFLDGASPPLPVAPAAGYDMADDAYDNPPSGQVGVTVTVLYDRDGEARPITVHSQIAQRLSSPDRVRAEANTRVLEIGSSTGSGFPVSLQAGLVHLSGAVSFGSEAQASLVSVAGELADGDVASTATGAKLAAQAPPLATTTEVYSGAQFLGADCGLACWGESRVPAFGISADEGRPMVGGRTSPAHVLLEGTGNGAISFTNGPTSDYLAALQLASPLVGLDTTATTPSGINGCTFTGTGTPSYLSAGGYLVTSDPDVSYEVEACAVGRSAIVKLLPTTFAPDGLVTVELQRASARCYVSGDAHGPDTEYDYSAVVRYWDGTAYVVAATITPSQTVDPLVSVPLDTAVGGGRQLGDYISSWSSVTSAEILAEESTGVARLKIPGVVRLVTEPVRQDALGNADPSSAVSLTMGALDCLAEDQR